MGMAGPILGKRPITYKMLPGFSHFIKPLKNDS